MSDTEMAQAPPREEEDLFGDEASNDGAHASDEDRMDEEKAALEYYEDDASASAPVMEEQTAWVNVPQLPMRRTKETLLARLPNFVRYKDRPFDPASWDERDDDADDDAEEVGDKHARSVLRTMSTIRWRWQDAGPSSYTPQSNARIVRWSDGSESLQIGSEFLDMTRHAEPSTQGMPLTYIYVPHPEEGLLEAECAVRTSLTFKPNVHSETHSKIASAIRHQRGMRVVVQGRLKQRSFETREGEKRTVYELEVDEVGPSLRYATAKVNKTQRSGGGQGGNFGGGNGGGNVSQGNFGGNSGGGNGFGGNSGSQGGNFGGSPTDDPWATGGNSGGGFGGNSGGNAGGQSNGSQGGGNGGWSTGPSYDEPPF